MAFLYPTTPPIKPFYDIDGSPLEGGSIYYGRANMNPETNPVQMYWDAAGTIPAPQPFRTRAGFIMRPGPGGTPANAFAVGDYSITIRNAAGAVVFTAANSVDLMLALAVTGAGTAAAIAILDAGGYYTTDNVEAALQQAAAPGFMSLAKLVGTDVLPFLAPTGARIGYCGITAPTGWVLGAGKTLGNAASGGTERANADTSTLYTLLWNSYSNTELVIQDSAGTPTTRGASAANDFAANKRLPTPDYRGRTGAGKDDMGGSTASRITNAGAGIVGTTMGAAGGAQTHVLTAAQMTDHTHTATQGTHNHIQDSHGHPGSTADAHTHAYTAVSSDAAGTASAGSSVRFLGTAGANTGAASVNTLTIAGVTATNQAASAGAITVSAASTSALHQNTQPTIMETVIIKL